MSLVKGTNTIIYPRSYFKESGRAQWVILGSIRYHSLICSGWKEAKIRRDWCGPHEIKLTTVLMEKKDKVGNFHSQTTSHRDS